MFFFISLTKNTLLLLFMVRLKMQKVAKELQEKFDEVLCVGCNPNTLNKRKRDRKSVV